MLFYFSPPRTRQNNVKFKETKNIYQASYPSSIKNVTWVFIVVIIERGL